MTPIRILHTADVHFDRENQEAALASLEALCTHGRDNGADLWVLAGDLFNRAVPNTGAAGFPRLVDVLQRMMNIAPVVAVQGTSTHDIPGCYDALQEIDAEFSFTLLDPRKRYFLGADGEVGEDPNRVSFSLDQSDETFSDERPKPRLLILGCPEPSKEWFLAGKEGLGRDEATQAVKDGMRQLLLGLGAIRRQYADLPCLMVYHGSVDGASLCNGQVLRPGELAIGRDDLALVGADYFALGHIHNAQKIEDLPAFYPGSAYPCNWGETDQKSFFEIELDPLLTARGLGVPIHQIPFPHPPRRKIVLSGTECASGIEGFQVWEVRRLPKDEPFDQAAELAWLETHGALPGSRVTIEVIPTETVRAGEISAAQGLADKLRIYAENSGEELPAGSAEKAAALEAEARATGAAGEGLHVRIDRLRLRGAIGIWKGLGQDEIDLDLSRYDPGLIALVGANGRGKTTLIENMHPYPEMLTRTGTLQEHFRLKDSFRELYFTDERSGAQYRALIQIDGANASGRAEYHLFRDGQPLTNGRKADYEQAIERLFGSLSLFVRSAFVSQKPPKNHPDLTDATKGEKKALFRELAGLDYLQTYSEAAREKAKALEAETERDAGRIQALEEILTSGAGKAAECEKMAVEAGKKASDLQQLEEQGRAAREEVEDLRQKVDRNRDLEVRIRELEIQDEKLVGELEQISRLRVDYQDALQGRQKAEIALAEIEALKAEEGRLHGEQARVLKERERIHRDYLDARGVAEAAARQVQAAQAKLDRTAAVLGQKKEAAVDRVDELEQRLAEQIECPACHHRFRPDAEALRAKLAQAQEEAFEADKALEATRKDQERLAAELAQISYPAEPELPSFDDSRLRTLQAQIQARDETGNRKILAAAAEAEVRIQEGEKRQAQIQQQQTEAQAKSEELRGKLLGTEVEDYYTSRKQFLTNTEAAYRTQRDELKGLEASIAALEKQITELTERSLELDTLRLAVAGKQRDAAEWRYLERACGQDGIQALELDAIGPGIAEVANRLLAAAYGSRFAIEFRTTRIGGNGSKRRMIEDFQIAVLDSEHGTEQLLETLSGGEAVWVKRAIYDAFGIIRDRTTGQRFLTVFQDEADGALDPEARLAYFRMLEAAHQEAGRRHTLVITHSQEAQEQIGQHIRMDELREKVEVVT